MHRNGKYNGNELDVTKDIMKNAIEIIKKRLILQPELHPYLHISLFYVLFFW